jgi:hypothetical protein
MARRESRIVDVGADQKQIIDRFLEQNEAQMRLKAMVVHALCLVNLLNNFRLHLEQVQPSSQY